MLSVGFILLRYMSLLKVDVDTLSVVRVLSLKKTDGCSALSSTNCAVPP